MTNTKLFRISSLLLCLIVLGCSSKNSEFYILNPAKLPNIQQSHACRHVIMLDRIKIPGYIDKPEIVTRSHQNQLNQAEFHRWGEPLGNNLSEVIAQNLSSQLKHDWILTRPKLTTSRVNYYLAIDIDQFDVDSHGHSILKVKWSIYTGSRKLIMSKISSYQSCASDPSHYADITNAMNNNITAFSRDLAVYFKYVGCDKPG